MNNHENDSGNEDRDKSLEVNNHRRRAYEIEGENRLVQRVQLKFREAVGRAMEEISDKEIREGIQAIQNDVLVLLRKLQEESGLHDKSLQLFEDEVIDAKVNAFIAATALESERKIRQHLIRQNNELRETLDSSQAELRKEMYDDLTGVYRKKYLLNGLRKTLSLLQREAYSKPIPLSVMFFDIDYFKKVNDKYGHQAGDEVLSNLGEIIGNMFQRESDTVGRYGGEEFVAVLPRCNIKDAKNLAESLRSVIEDTPMETVYKGKIETFGVTISVGVVTALLHKVTDGKTGRAMDYILKQADTLLYECKQTGRNKVSLRQVDVGENPEELGGVLV